MEIQTEQTTVKEVENRVDITQLTDEEIRNYINENFSAEDKLNIIKKVEEEQAKKRAEKLDVKEANQTEFNF
jgi:transposase-like protein